MRAGRGRDTVSDDARRPSDGDMTRAHGPSGRRVPLGEVLEKFKVPSEMDTEKCKGQVKKSCKELLGKTGGQALP